MLVVLVYTFNYYPKNVEEAEVFCPENSKVLTKNQKIKILNWNVQYMAGKDYVFFYDILDNSGPDTRPARESIAKTINEVARVIKDEKPDIIMLQELDDGSKRTDYEDQLDRLLGLLPDEYECHTSAYYHKSTFVPHPKIMGKVGMKESIISKYKISDANRYQLEQIPENFLVKQFNFRRAILEATIPVDGGDNLSVLTTHLDAFSQGTDTMEKQIAQVDAAMQENLSEGEALIGGDFNLLPPGRAYDEASDEVKQYYNSDNEIKTLFNKYQAVPSFEDANSDERSEWFTHFPNNPNINKPDRTIDYFFLSNNINILNSKIRQSDTLDISDHLPVVIEIEIP